jgi:hypothetical protein
LPRQRARNFSRGVQAARPLQQFDLLILLQRNWLKSAGGDADTRALHPGANSAHQYNFLASGPLPAEREMVVTGAAAALGLSMFKGDIFAQ